MGSLLVTRGYMEAEALCRTFKISCDRAGMAGSWMQSHLVYVVRHLSFGIVGGIDVLLPEAPVQHTYMGQVNGFAPPQIRYLGFHVYDDIVLQCERSRGMFVVSLTMSLDVSQKPHGMSLRRLILRPVDVLDVTEVIHKKPR